MSAAEKLEVVSHLEEVEKAIAKHLEKTGGVAVQPGNLVRDRILLAVIGVTPEMARKYRERGVWLEDKHWRFDPMGRVVYNLPAIQEWFEGKL